MSYEAAILAAKGVMGLFVFLTVFFFVKYIRDYRVVQMLVEKLRGNAAEVDRIKRTQVKEALETSKSVIRSAEAKGKKTSLATKVFAQIDATGVLEAVPGFSETTFIAVVLCLDGALAIAVAVARNLVVAAAVFVVVALSVWYSLTIAEYVRRTHVDSQLLQFTNACATASRQYSNIVDIVGSIYDQFTGAFRDSLQAFYIEAKATNDRDAAIEHLKSKFSSDQLAFVLDNFVLCSQSTGDYYSVAMDLSKTIAIYVASHEKKAVVLRNAKVNICVMFVICIAIVLSMEQFFSGAMDVMLNTTVGNVLLVSLGGVFFYGMSMKAEK